MTNIFKLEILELFMQLTEHDQCEVLSFAADLCVQDPEKEEVQHWESMD